MCVFPNRINNVVTTIKALERSDYLSSTDGSTTPHTKGIAKSSVKIAALLLQESDICKRSIRTTWSAEGSYSNTTYIKKGAAHANTHVNTTIPEKKRIIAANSSPVTSTEAKYHGIEHYRRSEYTEESRHLSTSTWQPVEIVGPASPPTLEMRAQLSLSSTRRLQRSDCA